MKANVHDTAAENQGKSEAQAPISCASQIVISGMDTIHLSLSLEIPEPIIDDLRTAKQTIQEGDREAALWKFGETNLFSWELARTGIKLFPFVLRMGDITLALSARKSDSRIPNAKLCIGSLSSNNNPADLWETVQRWFTLHGIKLVKETVSRVDLFADVEAEIEKLHLISQARMVTRAEKVAYYYANRRLTGLQVGSSSVVLRMYDKIQEMKDKKATAKQLFFQSLWKKEVAAITRVEFQIRRDGLRDFFPESCTFLQLRENLPGLWRYLTEDWFRHTARAVDRKNRNQSRETTSPFWQGVQAAFDLAQEALVRVKRLKVFNLKALVEQAGGIMVTIAAGLGVAYDDIFGIMATMQETIGFQVEDILSVKGERDYYRRAAACRVTV